MKLTIRIAIKQVQAQSFEESSEDIRGRYLPASYLAAGGPRCVGTLAGL